MRVYLALAAISIVFPKKPRFAAFAREEDEKIIQCTCISRERHLPRAYVVSSMLWDERVAG